MDYLSTAWNLLGYISLPVVYILNLIFSILNIVTAPLQHLVQYTAYACWYPISLLAKFETLYIFFGVAVLVGALTGIILHYVSSIFVSVLNIDDDPKGNKERTLSSYRREKQERLHLGASKQANGLAMNTSALDGEHADWEGPKSRRGRSTNRVVPNTILEEDDSLEDDI